jgi:hypothetical protein
MAKNLSREKKLEKALNVAVDALAFYSDPETYFAVAFILDRPSGPFEKDFDETELGLKPGKRARKAFLKMDKILNSSSKSIGSSTGDK